MDGRLTKFRGKGYGATWVLEACLYVAIISINGVIYLGTCYPLGNLIAAERYFNIFFFPMLAIELLAVWLVFHLIRSFLVIRDVQIDLYIGRWRESQEKLSEDIQKVTSASQLQASPSDRQSTGKSSGQFF